MLWKRLLFGRCTLCVVFDVLAFGFESTYNFGWFDANVLLTMTNHRYYYCPTGCMGIYHSFAQITLAQFYGMPSEKPFAFAFVAHGVGYFLNILVGGISLCVSRHGAFVAFRFSC